MPNLRKMTVHDIVRKGNKGKRERKIKVASVSLVFIHMQILTCAKCHKCINKSKISSGDLDILRRTFN